ncbi:hypothetical protein [Streptoalloteichus tenebrarius]|nr:hypothetical protein [Streptoalloteichus tenebrarius]
MLVLQRRPDEEFLPGLWELPSGKVEEDEALLARIDVSQRHHSEKQPDRRRGPRTGHRRSAREGDKITCRAVCTCAARGRGTRGMKARLLTNTVGVLMGIGLFVALVSGGLWLLISTAPSVDGKMETVLGQVRVAEHRLGGRQFENVQDRRFLTAYFVGAPTTGNVEALVKGPLLHPFFDPERQTERPQGPIDGCGIFGSGIRLPAGKVPAEGLSTEDAEAVRAGRLEIIQVSILCKSGW